MNTPPPKLMLDLSRTLATHVSGDITAHMTWTLHNREPCIVLIPTHARLHYDRVTPCIVPLAHAWAWDETTGDGTHAAAASFFFAASLGMSQSPAVLIRVASLIRDLLGDLLAMPPMPHFYDPQIVGETTLTDRESGTTRQSEITEHV